MSWAAAADLRADLDKRLIEHLDVAASRTFVLSRETVLDLGCMTECSLGRVWLWSQGFTGPVSNPDPAAVIAMGCRTLVMATDITCR